MPNNLKSYALSPTRRHKYPRATRPPPRPSSPPTRAAAVVASLPYQARTPPGGRQFGRRGYSAGLLPSSSSSATFNNPSPPPRTTPRNGKSICAPQEYPPPPTPPTANAADVTSRPSRELQISLGMTTAAEGDPGPPFSLLLLLDLPDGFAEKEVLRRLGPRALASLAGAGRACAAAVVSTALMQWAEDEKNLPPRRFKFATWSEHAPRLCMREACLLAARGGHLEVLQRAAQHRVSAGF